MRLIDGVSHRMLTLTLRGLDHDGLVKRTVYAPVTPKVEYELTAVGASLVTPLSALSEWDPRRRPRERYWAMAESAFYKLGRIAGVQVRKAKWMWASVAGNEAEGIRAEQAVGRDMAAVVLEETPRDSDRTTQALLDEIGGKLAAVVRNRLHRFQTTAIESDRPTAFALPGGFIFIARSLVQLCDRNKDDVAFVLAHEMAHVIRRHAIERLLQQKVVNAVALAAPSRGALAAWIRRIGFQGLERAYSQDEEFEADELGVLLMRAAGFDPAGAIRMLQRLGKLDRSPDSLGLNRYLSTHPPIDERVNRLRRLAAGSS